MSDDDVLDLLSGDPIDTTDPDSDVAPGAGDAHVCAHVDDGKVCGATFDTASKLNAHRVGKHRDRSNDKPRGGDTRSARARGGSDKRPSRKREPAKAAADRAAAPSTDRAQVYTASIAMFAIGGYTLIPAFDEYDLTVLTSGAPNLGAALASVAAQNPAVAAALDLALGGGTGGAYVQLFMAAIAIGVPIAAHHGALPQSAGERFGAMLGVAPQSPVAPTPAPEPATARAPEHDEVPVPSFDPDTPTTDFDSLAMVGRGATVVAVPDTVAASHAQPAEEVNGDGGGSEQLNPERARTGHALST